MSDIITLAISILALIISLLNIWLTYLNRGKVHMTSPSMIVFAYDSNGSRDAFDPKVMVRCHIFSTGERGQVIEALYAQLINNTSNEIFPIWGIDTDHRLVRGGGLWVGKTGITAWHHFVANTNLKFTSELYTIEVYAKVHGLRNPQKLCSTKLSIPTESALRQHNLSEMIWFDHEPQSGKYKPHIETREDIRSDTRLSYYMSRVDSS